MEKREKILFGALIFTFVGAAAFFSINAIVNPPLSEEEQALIATANEFGKTGQPEIKPMLNSIAKSIDGEVDISDEGMKVLKGYAMPCELDGKAGGLWQIDGLITSEVKPSIEVFELAAREIKVDHEILTHHKATPDALNLTGEGSLSADLKFLKDDTYEITLNSTCHVK